MIYKVIKAVISRGNYVKADIMNKLGVFLASDQISIEEYNELVEILNSRG